MTFNKYKLQIRIPCYLVFVSLLTLMLSACGPESEEKAYLSFPSYSTSKFNPRLNKVSSRAFDNSELNLSSLIIEIKTSQNKRVKRFDILKIEGELHVEVPANVGLVVSGIAFVGNTIQYEGQVLVNGINPGKTQSANLILHDVNNSASELQIDITFDNSPANGLSKGIGFSRDNNYVLFYSNSNNLIENDDNDTADVYLKSLTSNRIENLHSDDFGSLGISDNAGFVSGADISEDGVYVVISSDAPNLVTDDKNGLEDVFLKNTVTSHMERISLDDGTAERIHPSFGPQISDDGTIISYFSQAPLDEGSLTIFNRVNRKYLVLGINSFHYILSGDGKYIVYQNNEKQLLLFSIEQEEEEEIFVSEEKLGFDFNITQNGDFIAFIPRISGETLTQNQFYLYNRTQKKTKQLSVNTAGKNLSQNLTQTALPAISSNGNYAAFSYDNTIYLRERENNNIAKVSEGIDPFLSRDGSRLGYTRDNNLFIVDNPLYLNSNITSKTTTPTELEISSFIGGFNLSWQQVPDASYYRVYQTTAANIANNRELNDFSATIYETKDNTYTINKNLLDGTQYYYIVTAINQLGESDASNEVNEMALIDESAPQIISINSPSTQPFVISNRVIITTSEELDADTVTADNISIRDALGVRYPINARINGTEIVVSISNNFLFGEQYTVRVENNVTDLSGNRLSAPFERSFVAWDPINEGSSETPISLDLGTYKGQVNTGTSYYSFSFPLDGFSDKYAVIVKNAPIDVSTLLVDEFGNPISNLPNFDNIYLFDPNLSEMSGPVLLTVDGSDTQLGAIFTVEVVEINDVFVSSPENIVFTTLESFGDKQTINLSGLASNTTYVLDFPSIAENRVQIRSVFNDETNCVVTSTDTMCEITTNINGQIILSFSALSSVNMLNVLGDILPVTTVDISEMINPPINENLQQPASNLFLNEFFDFADTQLVKYTGFPSNRHVVSVESDFIALDAKYKLSTNNWNNVQCSEDTILNEMDAPLCEFDIPTNNSNIYLRIDNVAPSGESLISFYITNSIFNVESFTGFFSSNDSSNYEIFVIGGVAPNTDYDITLTANQITNAEFGADLCLQTHDTETISCAVKSDDFGYIFFTYGGSVIETSIGVSIAESSQISIIPEELNRFSISPYADLFVNELMPTSTYLVHASNFLTPSPEFGSSVVPLLFVYDEFSELNCFTAFYDDETLSCAVQAVASQMRVEVHDGSLFTEPPVSLDVSAEVVVTELLEIDITDQPLPISGQINSYFSLYSSTIPNFGENVTVEFSLSGLSASSALSFKVFDNSQLAVPICTSTRITPGAAICPVTAGLISTKFYILIDGKVSAGESFMLDESITVLVE